MDKDLYKNLNFFKEKNNLDKVLKILLFKKKIIQKTQKHFFSWEELIDLQEISMQLCQLMKKFFRTMKHIRQHTE